MEFLIKRFTAVCDIWYYFLDIQNVHESWKIKLYSIHDRENKNNVSQLIKINSKEYNYKGVEYYFVPSCSSFYQKKRGELWQHTKTLATTSLHFHHSWATQPLIACTNTQLRTVHNHSHSRIKSFFVCFLLLFQLIIIVWWYYNRNSRIIRIAW